MEPVPQRERAVFKQKHPMEVAMRQELRQMNDPKRKEKCKPGWKIALRFLEDLK